MKSRSRSQINPLGNACKVGEKPTAAAAAEDACQKINRRHIYPLRTVWLRAKKQLLSKTG